MKKSLILFSAVSLFLAACNKNVKEAQDEKITEKTGRRCASYEVLEEQIKKDPSLKTRMKQIENFTTRYANSIKAKLKSDGVTMTIPVYVNVLYNTAAQNISD